MSLYRERKTNGKQRMDNGQDIQGMLRCPIRCSVYVSHSIFDTHISPDLVAFYHAKVVGRIRFTWENAVLQGQERRVVPSNGGHHDRDLHFHYGACAVTFVFFGGPLPVQIGPRASKCGFFFVMKFVWRVRNPVPAVTSQRCLCFRSFPHVDCWS